MHIPQRDEGESRRAAVTRAASAGLLESRSGDRRLVVFSAGASLNIER
jgi:hypothetical protein